MDKKTQFIVGIPSRNRSVLLEEKVQNIINWNKKYNLDFFKGLVVADNSDIENNICSKLAFNSKIEYIWDGTNVGYGGNIRRLCCHAKGYFLWIIGDDDIIYENDFLKVNNHFRENNVSNYITFSSVINDYSDFFKKYYSPKKEKFLRLSSNQFISHYWKSVIFLSANIMYVEKKFNINNTRKISRVFENSVLAYQIISESKTVDIIISDSPIDTLTRKLYYPDERFRNSVIEFLDVIDSILKFYKTNLIKDSMYIEFKSKFISAIFYSLFFEIHGFESNLVEMINSLNLRLKSSLINPFIPKIIYNLLKILFPILKIIIKKINKKLVFKIFSIIFKEKYHMKLNFMKEVLSSKGMEY